MILPRLNCFFFLSFLSSLVFKTTSYTEETCRNYQAVSHLTTCRRVSNSLLAFLEN
jgi:hypothetical protein